MSTCNDTLDWPHWARCAWCDVRLNSIKQKCNFTWLISHWMPCQMECPPNTPNWWRQCVRYVLSLSLCRRCNCRSRPSSWSGCQWCSGRILQRKWPLQSVISQSKRKAAMQRPSLSVRTTGPVCTVSDDCDDRSTNRKIESPNMERHYWLPSSSRSFRRPIFEWLLLHCKIRTKEKLSQWWLNQWTDHITHTA